MLNQNHIDHQISDYLLGLLSQPAQDALEAHTAVCQRCRQAVAAEQTLAKTVRQTLHKASQPNSTRLQALRPAPPQRSIILFWRTIASAPFKVAFASLLIMMLWWGSLQFSRADTPLPLSSPTALAVTATATAAPTQTATEIRQTAAATTATAVAAETATAMSAVAPDATPIAAVWTVEN